MFQFHGVVAFCRGMGAAALLLAALAGIAAPARAQLYYPTYHVTSPYNIDSIVLAGRGDDPETEGPYLVRLFNTEPGTTTIVDPFKDDYYPLETFFLGLTDLVPGRLPGTTPGDELHLVVAVNNFFGASALGQEFLTMFPGWDELDLINALLVLSQPDLAEGEDGYEAQRDAVNAAVDMLFSFSYTVYASQGDFLINEGFTVLAFSQAQEIGTGTSSITLAAAVPEPGTWAMLILGFGMIGGLVRARRRTEVAAFA